MEVPICFITGVLYVSVDTLNRFVLHHFNCKHPAKVKHQCEWAGLVISMCVTGHKQRLGWLLRPVLGSFPAGWWAPSNPLSTCNGLFDCFYVY